MPLGFVVSKWVPIPRVAGFEIHMSVSSISSTSAPLPFNYLDTNNNTQPAAIVAAVVTPASDSNNDAGAAQPPAPAPLPPGQGTRVDQLV
jgi:hypothetical protein